MSTKCLIGVEKSKGKIAYIECFSEGYVDGVGKILLSNYNNKKIEKLLGLGDIESLGESIEECEICKCGGKSVEVSLSSFLSTDYFDYKYYYSVDGNLYVHDDDEYTNTLVKDIP